MTNRERFQLQFDSLCRQEPQLPSKPLTGIEREESEQREAKAFWDALERGNHE